MIRFTRFGSVIALSLAISASACANSPEKTSSAVKVGSHAATASAENVIANWPDKSKEVAQTTIKKYGQPNESTASMLIWHDNGPWKRTIIHREPVPHHFPIKHVDVLQQFVNYQVPPQKFDELALYDGSVVVERTNGEMSARCDKEPMNFLAINLAHDIAKGKKSVDEARKSYAQIAMGFMNGKSHAYVEGLQFPPQKNTNFTDEPSPAAAKMSANTQ